MSEVSLDRDDLTKTNLPFRYILCNPLILSHNFCACSEQAARGRQERPGYLGDSCRETPLGEILGTAVAATDFHQRRRNDTSFYWKHRCELSPVVQALPQLILSSLYAWRGTIPTTLLQGVNSLFVTESRWIA